MMKNNPQAHNFQKKLVDFVEKTNYTCDIVTFDEMTNFINDLQWSEEI